MKSEDRIRDLFARALEKTSPAERETFLAEACPGEPELRRQVESLLQAHEQAGDFLRVPIVPKADIEIERTGAMIGRYKILQQIGEGGFGVVYMAEQVEPVQRRVALKIIKPGMDTREVVARFEAERQALALMDHPNIARVLDAGATAAGRPYFVMELVNGIPITDFCDRQQLDTAARLQLFMKVCHAVQHAHQKGIIHRDLKPNNVLVTLHDGEPVPKVIDFGVAKALGQKLTDKTLFTAFRHMIGTPAYMSPEQAELSGLDIDTRADIYSLGVLLYELLTGETPFDPETLHKAALDEIRRMIRETEPPKPSTRLQTLGDKLSKVAQLRQTEPAALRRLVCGDLDWIVMKALEKDRTRRYETADAFNADLRRFIANEPITACPPSTLYRLRKAVRRNRLVVLAAGSVVGSLILGLGVSTHLFLKERAERQRAVDAEQAERAMRQKAQAGEASARALQEWNEGHLSEAELEQRAALTLWRAWLGNAHPQVGAALEQLASILRDEGKLDEAVATYHQALEVKRLAFQTEPVKWDSALKRLAEALNERGPYGAERLLDEVLPQAQARLQMIELLREQASAAAQQGHWQEAMVKYSRLIDQQPANPLPYHALAALLADMADQTNYDHFCCETQRRFRSVTDALVAGGAARDCLLMKTSQLEGATVMAWSDAALAAGSNHWAAASFDFTRGLADYRRGNYAESLGWLDRALNREQEPGRRAQGFFVSAMAQARLGNTNAAPVLLRQGLELVETRLPKIENGLLGEGWIDWLTAHVLRHEARALFEAQGLAQ